jgi:hypothetical protein
MLIDSAPLIASMDMTPELGPLVVRRAGASTINAYHEHVAGAEIQYQVTPWVAHTADGTSLSQVPEADRSLEHVEVYGVDFMFELADRFAYAGEMWRVNTRHNYIGQGGVSFATAAKEDPQ